MKKIIVIPDSFKGTLSAADFCGITKKAWAKHFPDCKIVLLPLADGGEGTTDCFIAMDGYMKVNTTAKNSYMEDIPVYYAVKGNTAVMEMAACASLTSVKGRENPGITTTYGVGQMIAHRVNAGYKNIILGLGGSCTNDAGRGMAAALGVKFFDEKGEEFTPTGYTLEKIKNIDFSRAEKLLTGVQITAMCDINNPLYGTKGAAYIFGPQKGADRAAVEILDKNLKYISDLIYKIKCCDYSQIPGAGAAGGMGFGVCAFLNGSLKGGVNLILDEIDFEKQIESTDLIITGEGRLDSQSLGGKAVVGIARRRQKVPVIAVVGGAMSGYEPAYETGLTAVFTVNQLPEDLSVSGGKTAGNLEKTIDNIARFAKAIK